MNLEDKLIKLAEDLNEQYANEVSEADTNYFPPNTFEDCFDIFVEEAEKIAKENSKEYNTEFGKGVFAEDNLQDIFSDCWTGKYQDGDEGDYDD